MKNYVESFDDIVFQDRNKEYGAYYLRKTYLGRGSVALFFTLGIFVLGVVGPFLFKKTNKVEDLKMGEVFRRPLMVEFKTNEKVEPLPKPPPGHKINQNFAMPKFVDTVFELEQEVPAIIDLEEGRNDKNTVTDVYQTNNKTIINQVTEEEKYFTTVTVHEKPMFIGGESKLLEYLSKNTRYPVTAIEKGIEGTVYIRFLVSKTGNIGEAKILRGVDPELDEEALRVVKSMPGWIPGKVNGYPVNVWFIVPVKFVLKF